MTIFTVLYESNNPQIPPAELLRRVGPTIRALVSLPELPGTPSQTGGKQPPPVQQVGALIDTGAFDSCIDEHLATGLQLPIIDRQTVSGVHGPEERNVYLGQINVPDLRRSRRGRFVGLTLADHHHVILGREFLRGVIFIYDGETGRVQLCT